MSGNEAACTPLPIEKGGFNPKAQIPYGVTVNHVRKAMQDYIDFLGFGLSVLVVVSHEHPDAEKVDFIVERNEPVTNHIQEFHAAMGRAVAEVGRPDMERLVGELIPGGKGYCGHSRLEWQVVQLQPAERRRVIEKPLHVVAAERRGGHEVRHLL